MSPLVALSGHANGAAQCLLSGAKQTWLKDGVRSALTQSRLSSPFGNTLGDDAPDPTDHHLHCRFVRQSLTAERSPREKIGGVPECSGEKLSSLVAIRPGADENLANTLAVGNAVGRERAQLRHILKIAQDFPHSMLVARIVLVKLCQPLP